MMTKTVKSKKSKKSTTKKRSFTVSPLIPIIALIEVLVLIAASTYSWYYFRASKEIGSGTISVAADSGLDIDFQYSNIDDYINIWNYVGSDFTFEPATSLDGRTIYFPTSGTFDNDTTANTVFRDGTVNDINSKYLSIDFELTNTSDYDQYVYLNNKSYFHVQDVNSPTYEESRALRLAFYQNDGNSGNVGSSLLNSGSSSDGGVIDTPASADAYTIYFDNSSLSWGTNPVVYAYFYDSDDGSNPVYHTAWPGVQMSRVSGQTYKVTIENPCTGGTKVKYDKIIISNNGSNDQRVTYSSKLLTSDNGRKFTAGNNSISDYTEHTVYFVKPYAWQNDYNDDGVYDVYCHTWHTGGNNNTLSYTTWPGDLMTYVGSGIYAYTYDGTNTGGFLFDDGSGGSDKNQTVNIPVPSGGVNGRVYYTQSNGSTYTTYDDYKTKFSVTHTTYSSLNYRTIYFFNTYGWEKPYATVSYGSGGSVTTCDIALTSLSGNVYYCTVPSTVYNYVYFRAKNQVNDTYRTVQDSIVDQQVYRPKDPASGNYRAFDKFMYDKYIKTTGYPVISPGVSAGFQRPYSPVITIDAYSGSATEIVPAYSNSIDNYILGSGTPLFILKSNHMASLSMIMWLEGTDEACTGSAYAGKQIDMRLEFSTQYTDSNNEVKIVNPGDSNAYIYNFYDKTREIWTSDRQPTESGVTVAPVMQLYDNTTKRGYLMSPSKYASYNGKQKVSCWTVSAPQSIALNGHDIIFRRVNPYNEDEVWNYWYAGPVAGNGSQVVTDSSLSVYSIAQSTTITTNDTINFTAFADGSPTETNLITAKYNNDNNKDVTILDDTTLETLRSTYSDYLSDASVPSVSCGGLWGNHSVRTVTMLDGLSGQPLKNNSGIITVNYTYKYKVGATEVRDANIEYKASGPDYNSLYYIIMPSVAYTNSLHCTFKHYTNFDSGYAINSERNNNITFEDTYGDNQQVTGEYFELSKKSNGDDYSFWGSDMLVVQTSWETKDYFFTGSDKDRLLQVHFYKNNSTSKTGEYTDGDWYSFLYYNESFKSSDGTGFITVVPNDKQYYKYGVEVCKYNGTSIKHMTDLQTLTYTTLTVTDSNAATYSMKVNHLNNQNICKLDKIEAYIYLQTSYQSYNNDPKVYSFSNSNGEAWSWSNNKTMEGVESVSGVGYKYKYKLRISKYEKAIFAFPQQGGKQSNEVSVSPSDVVNGTIFQCNSYNNGNPWAWKIDAIQNDERNDTAVTKYTETVWPHYTAQ